MKKLMLIVFAAGALALGGYVLTGWYDYSVAEAQADEAAAIDAGLTVSAHDAGPGGAPAIGISDGSGGDKSDGGSKVKDPISDPGGYSKDMLNAYRAAQYAFFVVLTLFGLSRVLLWIADKYHLPSLVKARPYIVFGSSVLGGAILSLAALEHIDVRVVAGAVAAAFMLELRGGGGNVEAKAKRMYQAYGDHAEWKSWNGGTMPTWDDLNDAVRSHWIATAKAT